MRELTRLLSEVERLASRPIGGVVLLVLALSAYAIEAVAWPLTAGRDLDEYLLFYLQAFNAETVLPWTMLFRTPGTPAVVGPVLDLAGGELAEPVAALVYAGSIVAWAATARAWGNRVAIATAVALLVVRAASPAGLGRWAAAGLALAFVVLVRPGNIVLLPLAAVPLLAATPWRDRAVRTAAFAAAAAVPLVVWVVHNGLRYDEWGLARGGKAVIPFYRVLPTDHLTDPDAGPASRRLAAAIRRDLVTREPYRSYRVTVDDVFERATARVHEDLYIVSDQQFGWSSDYGVLRDAALEAIERRPGEYLSGVAHTTWEQLSEPYYRLAPSQEPTSERPRPTGARVAGAERGTADSRRPEPVDLAPRPGDPANLGLADEVPLHVR